MKAVFFLAVAVISAGFAHAQEPVTMLLYHANVWTGNPAQPHAEAVALSGNRIVAVGTDSEVLKLRHAAATERDLDGRLLLPGFNDAHVHMFAGGSEFSGPQLRLSKSAEEFRDTLGAYANGIPRGTWITGGQWDHESWAVPKLPSRDLIDAQTRDWPVLVTRLDGHMSLANSAALKLAGIDSHTKDVPGGVIVRDSQGLPTGILKDAAQELVRRVVPPPAQEQIIKALRAAQTYANAQGVTSVQDMFVGADVLRAYRTMARTGQLRLRISAYVPLADWHQFTSPAGDDYFRIRGVKGYADGSLGSTTALLFEPYLDAPETSGIPGEDLADPVRMFDFMRAADAAGLQLAIHAIGDKANHVVLDMYERVDKLSPGSNHRFRIEHAQHLRAVDIPRFGRQHIIASMQPYHCIDDGRWAVKRLGAERLHTSYAWRSLLDSGATLAFGSDWPVAPMSPFLGIYAAATRRTLDDKYPDGWVPEQKISVEEAVRAYTSGAAHASFDESRKGTIAPGKLADLVVLDQNIFEIDPTKIRDANVFAVIFDGKVITAPPYGLYQRLPSGLILRP